MIFSLLLYFWVYAILDVLIAAKTGEYLASGLPLLVQKETLTLNELVDTNKLGLVYDDINDIESCLDEIDIEYDDIKHRNIKFAQQYFSNVENANKYIELYRRLL